MKPPGAAVYCGRVSSMALLWCLLLAALAAPSAAARCDCLALLQADVTAGKRPRDCTCITGMKTYATTPRDKLKAMGKVALRYHLQKCDRERDALKEQKEYQIAANEVQVKDIQEMLGLRKKALQQLKDQTVKKQSKLKSEMNELTKADAALEKELPELKTEYNKLYTEWYEMTKEMQSKLEVIASCEKIKTCKRSGAKSSFLLSRRQRVHAADPETDRMYDMMYKVEDCENENLKLSDDIKADNKKTQKKTFDATAGMDTVSRQDADFRRVSKLTDKGPKIKAMERVEKSLDTTVKNQREHVDAYKEKNKDLKTTLDDLKHEITECGC